MKRATLSPLRSKIAPKHTAEADIHIIYYQLRKIKTGVHRKMADEKRIAPDAPDEKDREAFNNIILGLWDEALSELDEHKAEIDEMTEYFIAHESWDDIPDGKSPKDTPYTKFFQMFFLGVGKGIELTDRINAL